MKGFRLDLLVHEGTNGLLLAHDIGQSSDKSGDIIHSIVVGTTTVESDGSSVIVNRDVFDSRRTRDCELHDENVVKEM